MLRLPGLWARGQAGPQGLKCFYWSICEEAQFPCHLGAFIFISKRKQNAELGIWQVFLCCLLAIANNAAVSMGVDVSFQVSIFEMNIKAPKWQGNCASSQMDQ